MWLRFQRALAAPLLSAAIAAAPWALASAAGADPSAPEAPSLLVAPEAAGFRALFPEAPRFAESEQSTLLGSLRTQSWEIDRGALRLRVERHELPRLALLLIGAESLLARAERSLLDDLHARAVASGPSDVGGHPGRVLHYEPGDRPGEREEARLALVGGVMFVAFARPAEGDDAAARAAAERFRASLELLGNGAVAAAR